jgi:enoyl-CoA hydratase
VYGMPEEIDVRADGPLRIITLNRPAVLNAVNDALHTGLARLWPRLSEDFGARAAVLTGRGKAFSAGGDVVYIAETAYLADPHVQVGLVAADGGPLTWPLHTSLLFAKEYALTGARIPAARAVESGLANHVAADPLAEAAACAERIASLPRQAVESTKRLLNLQLERAVLATLDFATTAEDQSFQTSDFRATIAKLTTGKAS